MNEKPEIPTEGLHLSPVKTLEREATLDMYPVPARKFYSASLLLKRFFFIREGLFSHRRQVCGRGPGLTA